MRIDIVRKDLFEQVWTMPLKKLAAEFGVSDAAPVKPRRRHQSPKPPMGHWTCVEYGTDLHPSSGRSRFLKDGYYPA